MRRSYGVCWLALLLGGGGSWHYFWPCYSGTERVKEREWERKWKSENAVKDDGHALNNDTRDGGE